MHTVHPDSIRPQIKPSTVLMLTERAVKQNAAQKKVCQEGELIVFLLHIHIVQRTPGTHHFLCFCVRGSSAEEMLFLSDLAFH